MVRSRVATRDRSCARPTAAVAELVATQPEAPQRWYPRTDLTKHSANDLAAVAAALNGRPRKTLSWKTPAEALDELLRSAQQDSVATTR